MTDLADVAARLRDAGSVFAEDEAAVLIAEAASVGALEAMIGRRIAGEPLETVVGWAAFCGLRVLTAPHVFVPRRRTELLARRAAALLPPGGTAVDLCCGTGAVAVAIAALARPGVLHAADLDPAAVGVARRNLGPWGGTVTEGDLFAALPDALRGRVDVLAVNAPYVPTAAIATMPPEARDHESRIALDGGADGLQVHRRIAAEARGWLAPGGVVLIETGRAQAAATAALLARPGLDTEVVRDDEVDGTVVLGSVPRTPAVRLRERLA